MTRSLLPLNGARLDKPVARRILEAVDALQAEPRPYGARPLVGYPDLWRVRIGDYRVVYAIKDAGLVVLALRVAHRSGVRKPCAPDVRSRPVLPAGRRRRP